MAVVSDLHILIFCLRVLLCIHIIQGLNIYGHGVCSKKNEIGDWEYFCCFNFYRLNGICTECENGTVSRDGISCTKCIGKTYGHQCKFKCICLAEERCDLRFGCVNDFHITTTETGLKVTVHEGTLETSSTIIPSGGSKPMYFYYALAGGMMGLSVLFAVCSIIFKKRLHNRPAIQQHLSRQAISMEPLQPHSRPSLPASLPPLPRISRHMYEAVDL